MKARAVALVAIVSAATFLLGWLAGRSGSSSGVRVYANETGKKVYTTAYHSDWPTYGLPIAEMAALNNLMDGGLDADELDRARRLVNHTLDLAVIDAHQRIQKLPDLPEAEAAKIREALETARKSRAEHPPPDSFEPWERERVEKILSQY